MVVRSNVNTALEAIQNHIALSFSRIKAIGLVQTLFEGLFTPIESIAYIFSCKATVTFCATQLGCLLI